MEHWLLSRFFIQGESIEPLNKTQLDALERFKHKVEDGEYAFESVPCLCGDKDGGLLISTRDRYGLAVHTHLCGYCGMMWTSPRMTEDSLKKFYEEDYRLIYVGSSHAPDTFFRDQIEHGERIYAFITSRVERQSRKPLKIFDIGCGAGGTLLPFKKDNGWLPFGCDLGEEYLNRGRKEGLTLEHGGAASLFQYAPANVVILSHVLEHFSNPLESINEISKLITKDGYLYVEVPGIFKIHSTYGDFLLFLQNAHLYHFSLSSLSTLMAQAGFKLVDGNEQISALYQKTENTKVCEGKNEFSKIKYYIYLTEIYRRTHIGKCVNSLKSSAMKMLRNM